MSLEEKIGWLCDSVASDDTVEMIADIDRAYFEDEFLLPRVGILDKKLSKVNAKFNPAGVLSKFYGRMRLVKHKGESDEEEQPFVAFTIRNPGNWLILRLATSKYRDEIGYLRQDSRQEMDEMRKLQIGMLREENEREVKIHHTNNSRLKAVTADRYASNIKSTISGLREALEVKQEKRKRGLGALIRSRYSGKESRV